MELIKYAHVMAIAMMPIIELRGAIPYGIANNLNFISVTLVAMVGNMLPVPFLILFVRKLFAWIKEKLPWMNRLICRLENRANGKSELVLKYGFWGICLLVAIPLPGTGAWTGSLVAAMLDMRLKKAVPAIALGLLTSALIVLVPSIGFFR
ncbi:MAG: small multi-drug export protein [Oscillospiraceae bacterium]|nr:small multi-drug export protein [Oscillospiraceae bacterium]